MALTPKQEAFVREYLIDLNATQAAIRAGYSAKTANEQGSQLLANLSVASAVQEAMDARAKRTEITADYVLEGIKAVTERCIGDDDAFAPMAAFKGYELLGKHLKLFTDKHEHSGPDGGAIQLEQIKNDAAAFTSAVIGLASRSGTASQA